MAARGRQGGVSPVPPPKPCSLGVRKTRDRACKPEANSGASRWCTRRERAMRVMPSKRERDDQEGVVRFTFGPGPGVALVTRAIIDDLDFFGRKRLGRGGREVGRHAKRGGAPEAYPSWGSSVHRWHCQRGGSSAHSAIMTRRGPRPRAYAPDPAAPGRPCEMPECQALGEFRAPKSRRHLGEYRWFCLDHVRAYNAAWDYYKGMSAGEIEAETPARHGLAAADLATRPTWFGGMGRGVPSRSAAPSIGPEVGQSRRRIGETSSGTAGTTCNARAELACHSGNAENPV